MSLKFKWKTPVSKVMSNFKHQLYSMMEEAREEVANFLYAELMESSPVDTTTFSHSWAKPEKISKGYKISNALPAQYIASGEYHLETQAVVAPYNLYILEGLKANAPNSYIVTNHEWEYRNKLTGQLLDTSILLWKFNQGALGLNPYTLLNQLFSKKVRSNI